MAYWEITEDHLALPGDTSYVGRAAGKPADGVPISTRFRILDDDGVVYYAGLADLAAVDVPEDNPHSLYRALEWAMADAGATSLEVWEPDKGWQPLFG